MYTLTIIRKALYIRIMRVGNDTVYINPYKDNVHHQLSSWHTSVRTVRKYTTTNAV